MSDPLLELHALATAAGVVTAYRDDRGALRIAGAEALLAVLRALEIDIDRIDQASDARHALEADRPRLEPCMVAWNGRLAAPLHVPAESGAARITLVGEDGSEIRVEGAIHRSGGGARIRLREPLPFGCFDLRIEAAGTFETFLISAPDRAFDPPPAPRWGVFLPLHAFGDAPGEPMTYGGLARASRALAAQGAAWVGTLPLLASFLDHPFDPSPYAPASRLFWNDLFIALDDDPAPRADAGRDRLFDYAAAAARRRPLLQARADTFFEAGGEHDADFRVFLETHVHAAEYARFRATCDHFRGGFDTWPEEARSDLGAVPLDVASVRRHLWGAWQAEQQIADLARAARAGAAAALYLDLPLGVHGQGFDVWRWSSLFARGVSAGAPPDALFRGGQDWGFRPLAPHTLRRSRYHYLIEVLRHHMRHAGALRIDHVMSLVRLFWIPAGFPATEGIYVRYPREELLALLVLESHRNQTRLVGEDLGTVPQEVRSAMDARNLLRMFVVQFVLGGPSLPHAPAGTAASLNTHDTPTFAGFWRGADIEDQRDLGLIDDPRADAAHAGRARLRRRVARLLGADESDELAVIRGLLRHLAGGPADVVLVTLEDLWAETEPQNVPGTSDERPNWRRRARFGIREALERPEIVRMLHDIDDARRRGATE